MLTKAWASLRRPDDHPLKGHCYVACEALYHLAGGAASGLSVFRCSVEPGQTHWWLVDTTGQALDPTVEQVGEMRPYAQGFRTFFLSKSPSCRARIVMARVLVDLGRS